MAVINLSLTIPDAVVPTVGEAVCSAIGKTCITDAERILALYQVIERDLVQIASQYYQNKQANIAREQAKQQAESMLTIGYPGKV